MTWTPLTIRDEADTEPGDMYPIPGDDVDTIWWDDLDTRRTKPVVVTKIELREFAGAQHNEILRVENIAAIMTVTDARVALVCSKYDKGGGWVGGATALAANAASKALAANRRRGKTLIGHVRWPWVAAVGYERKTGMLSDEMISITTATRHGDGQRNFRLRLTFPKNVNAHSVAHEIVARAARFRLTHGPLEDRYRDDMIGLTTPPPLAVIKDQLSVWNLPNSYLALPTNARGGKVDTPGDEDWYATQPSADQIVDYATAPGWRTDPTGRHQHRYWNGDSWTADVSDRGEKQHDEATPPEPGDAAASWQPDPLGRHQHRYWNGTTWTDQVANAGAAKTEPASYPAPTSPLPH